MHGPLNVNIKIHGKTVKKRGRGNFDVLRLFPNILTPPPFQRNYYPSLYCDFVLQYDLVT